MKKINKIFSMTNPLPLDLYLEKILYDENIEYYQKKNPFGSKGDFVTSPNISNLFSEMIAIWVISFWEGLDRPKKFNFIELGPGNGDFCLILMKALKNFPEVYNAINVFLYEKSDFLRKVQKKRIVSNKVSWISDLKKIKENPVIFFGNEFLDALPIKQFKKIRNNIFEKFVLFKNNKINFIYKRALKSEINKLKYYKLHLQNGIIEFPENGFKELGVMCSKIRELNGGALFIDYGYNKKKNVNTLQSVIKHKFNDISKNIGNADVTYLVNFPLYKEYFNYNSLIVENVISQSEFLQKMGIVERYKIASNRMSYKDKSNLYLRLKRLIDPNIMGKNFKVIFAKNKKCKFSLPFK